MAIAKYDIKIFKGQTFKIGLRLRDAANNNAFVGANSAISQVRESTESLTPFLTFTTSFSSNNETLYLEANAATTAALTKKSGMYDVRVTYPDRVEFIVKGLVKVYPTVSRA